MPFSSFSFGRSSKTTFFRDLTFVGFVAALGFATSASAQTIIPPNVPTRGAAATPDGSTVPASKIWSKFLFGDPNAETPKRRAALKFAFAPENRPTTRFQQDLQSARRDAVPVAPRRPDSSAQVAQISETPESVAEARRRRLQELNAILAAKRPDEYARRAPRSVANAAEPSDFAAPTTAEHARLIETERLNESVDARFVDAPTFDAARANRSKIRQTSAFVPSEAPGSANDFVDDALGFSFLPTRPNALRIAPQIFLSTEIVRLPSAGTLEDVAETQEIAEDANDATSAATVLSTATNAPRPLETAPIATTTRKSISTTPDGTPVFRPQSTFVDPKTVPDKR